MPLQSPMTGRSRNIRYIKICVIGVILLATLRFVLYRMTNSGMYLHPKLFIPYLRLESLPVISRIWPPIPGTLRPHDVYVVPNIAHFVWFSCHEFRFLNLLSIVSVHRYMKPDKIYFHTDCEPTDNKWWEEVKMIPTLEVKLGAKRRSRVFGQELNPNWVAHEVDVFRLEILLSYGGAYFDLDVFIFKSLDNLRRYDYATAAESVMKLNGGVSIGTNNSLFLKLFYESYRNYDSTCWDCNALFNHAELARAHQDLIHIEHNSIIHVTRERNFMYFISNTPWRNTTTGIHFLGGVEHFFSDVLVDLNPETIKQLHTSFGEMCRFVYYGQTDMITDDEPVAQWYTFLNIAKN